MELIGFPAPAGHHPNPTSMPVPNHPSGTVMPVSGTARPVPNPCHGYLCYPSNQPPLVPFFRYAEKSSWSTKSMRYDLPFCRSFALKTAVNYGSTSVTVSSERLEGLFQMQSTFIYLPLQDRPTYILNTCTPIKNSFWKKKKTFSSPGGCQARGVGPWVAHPPAHQGKADPPW